MSASESLTHIRGQLKSLNRAIPQTAAAFGDLSASVKGDGALSYKEKEYVALGIAVATRCEPCILFHTEALIKLGATRDEIAEVLATCIQMGGGPGLMYAGKALDIYDQLSV